MKGTCVGSSPPGAADIAVDSGCPMARIPGISPAEPASMRMVILPLTPRRVHRFGRLVGSPSYPRRFCLSGGNLSILSSSFHRSGSDLSILSSRSRRSGCDLSLVSGHLTRSLRSTTSPAYAQLSVATSWPVAESSNTPNDLRGTSGVGLGDGFSSHTSKWLQVCCFPLLPSTSGVGFHLLADGVCMWAQHFAASLPLLFLPEHGKTVPPRAHRRGAAPERPRSHSNVHGR